MKKKFTLLLFAITLLLSINSYAQDGSLDPNFYVGAGTDTYLSTTAI